MFFLVPFGRCVLRRGVTAEGMAVPDRFAEERLVPQERLWMGCAPLQRVFSLLGDVNVVFSGNQKIRT